MVFSKRFFIWVMCLAALACGNDKAGKERKHKMDKAALALTADTVIKGTFNTQSGIPMDSSAIDRFLGKYPDFSNYRSDFYQFYNNVSFQYVWYDKGGLIEYAQVLVSKLENVADEGVQLKIPYKQHLDSLINVSRTEEQTKPDLDLELMLSAQYFYYAHNLWGGTEVSKAESLQWYIPRKKLSYSGLLERYLSDKSIAAVEEAAVTPQYSAMKKALFQYRKIEGADIEIPAIKKSLRIEDSSAVITLIKQRLAQLGDLEQADSNGRYTPDVAYAVNNFKSRHGLKPDSVINSEMVVQLNVPVKDRIGQIVVNMERLRWIPVGDDTEELILVNVPEYKLHYYKHGRHDWSCNVVVGSVINKTVIFSGELQYVVFSPYWNVPQSIINKEVKPGMKRNANYLQRHNMEWNGGRVRQRPGPSNSLGLVKFLFPNSNNIYLHDTPSKSLFSREDRAFSHGCIRVAQPRELAIRVLQQDSTWTPERIDKAMHAGKEQYVILKRKIPVYIGYFTSFIDEEGRVNFRKDVYKKDEALLNLLMTE